MPQNSSIFTDKDKQEITGVDLGFSPGAYSQFEQLPALVENQEDSTQAAAMAAGLGGRPQGPPDVPTETQQPQPPAPDPNQRTAQPPPGDGQYATKQQALGDEEPPPGEGDFTRQRYVQEAGEDYDPYVGMENTKENQARKASGFYRFTDANGGEWWVDPWAVDGIDGTIGGVYGPPGANWNKVTGGGLPNHIAEYVTARRSWQERKYGEGYVGNAMSMYDQASSSDGRLNEEFGLTWKRGANGEYYMEIGEGGSRGIIINGQIYTREDYYNPNRKPLSYEEARALFWPHFGAVWDGEIRGALAMAKHMYEVGKRQGNPPPFRASEEGEGGVDRNAVFDADAEGDSVVDTNKNGIPDSLEGLNAQSGPSFALSGILDLLNKNISEEGNIETIKQTNAYESAQANRKLAQTMAGRGMADSGVAAEMGGQLGQAYSRDLADEMMKSQQQQNQTAMQLAQLMFGDKWQRESASNKERIVRLMFKNQKAISKYLNDLQQSNPGMIEAFFDDVWRAFGGD